MATICGSTAGETSLFGSKILVEPAVIDGKHVFNAGFSCREAVSLAPGDHLIGVLAIKSGGFGTSATTDIAVTVEGGKVYTIRSDPPWADDGAPNEFMLWIETGGHAVTTRAPVFFSGKPPPAPI